MNTLALADHGPVIPVIVLERVEHAVPLAEALVAGGVRVLEVTLRTPVALQCIEAIARAVPHAIVGAGTVRSAADAQAALRAGSRATRARSARRAATSACRCCPASRRRARCSKPRPTATIFSSSFRPPLSAASRC
jgi:2-dehydro-3-deoxyphosphogluconate aldolase/(4S)-4-hydroxy-2-oxoglutarate aldolase